MKKFYALLLSVVLLSACAASDDKMGDDAMMDDDKMMEDDAMMEDNDDAMMDDDKMMKDDGMVNGETHEDAGGDGTNTTGGSMMEDARVISIVAEDWSFSPATITAKKGEKVTLSITAKSGTHGLAIKDLGLNVKIPEGETVTVDLPTDKAGTFGGVCSVPCGSGHKDMHISVVISE